MRLVDGARFAQVTAFGGGSADAGGSKAETQAERATRVENNCLHIPNFTKRIM